MGVWIREVDDAVLSPFSQRRLAVPAGEQPSWEVGGAVYGRGLLVDESQRVGGLHGDHARSRNPPEYLPVAAEQLPGTWLYGGTWFNHFGHFLLETVTTLWPGAPVDGLVFHRFWFGSEVLPWQRAMLDLLGREGVPVRVVGDTPLRVERALLPVRSYVPHVQAAPAAVSVWRRMAAAAGEGAGHRRVFLSRSAANEAERATGSARAGRLSENEVELDELMRRRGFHVAFTEQLPVAEQVRLVKGADVLAGPSGSALHLCVFAAATTRVLELGDARDDPAPVLNQQILCRALGQVLGFVQHGQGPDYDLARVERAVVDLG